MKLFSYFADIFSLYFFSEKGFKNLKKISWIYSGAVYLIFSLIILTAIDIVNYSANFSDAYLIMFMLIIGFLINLASLAMVVLAYGWAYLIYKFLGGKADIKEHLKIEFSTTTPIVFINFTIIFLSLLAGLLLLGSISETLENLLLLGTSMFFIFLFSIWFIIVNIIYLAKIHQISYGRSTGAFFLTFLSIFIIGFILGILLLLVGLLIVGLTLLF